jgi:hypothetical protein
MKTWHQINDERFSNLFAEQYGELNSAERMLFDQYSVSPWKAVIRRSNEAGDEQVFVVAQTKGGVLYFDDVEYGFNVSDIDDSGHITSPGGSQKTLREAVIQWFPTQR